MELNITNGDVTAELLRRGGLSGDLLPWRDALHEGPVPGGLSLEEMSRMRARFISDSLNGSDFEQVHSEFTRRDDLLKAFKRYREVVLWFEHDLYDQLQLLQILHWFAQRGRGGTRLSLVCIDRYPGVDRFLGLGQLTPPQLTGLRDQSREIGRETLDLATRGWEAFCSERPVPLFDLLGEDTSPMPFLGPALVRHLEQFPWTRDGLSRTERQIVESVADGPADLRTVFRLSQIEREERPFLSDRAFLFHLRTLAGGRANLVQFTDGGGFAPGDRPPHEEGIWEREIRITEIGRRILGGQTDFIRLYGIDRWLGGVRLHGARAAWRWDGRRKVIVSITA